MRRENKNDRCGSICDVFIVYGGECETLTLFAAEKVKCFMLVCTISIGNLSGWS